MGKLLVKILVKADLDKEAEQSIKIRDILSIKEPYCFMR